MILATFNSPCRVQDIKTRAKGAGFRLIDKWNVSSILDRSEGLAIRTPEGWEITDAGKQQLRNLGVAKISPAAVQVATDLRAELAKIKDADTRNFVEEAINCYELGFCRSAMVMSWLAAVHILHRHVVASHLKEFNKEAQRVLPKWKAAKNTDDLGLMKESDFLDRLVAISVIGKDVKRELVQCLGRRNGCGHPNSLKIRANTVAHHLEILLLNVFQPFS